MVHPLQIPTRVNVHELFTLQIHRCIHLTLPFTMTYQCLSGLLSHDAIYRFLVYIVHYPVDLFMEVYNPKASTCYQRVVGGWYILFLFRKESDLNEFIKARCSTNILLLNTNYYRFLEEFVHDNRLSFTSIELLIICKKKFDLTISLSHNNHKILL